MSFQRYLTLVLVAACGSAAFAQVPPIGSTKESCGGRPCETRPSGSRSRPSTSTAPRKSAEQATEERAFAAFDAQRWPESVELFQQLLRIRPTAQRHYKLAYALWQSNRIDEAAASYWNSYQADRKDRWIRQNVAAGLNLLATTVYNRTPRDLDRAEQWLKLANQADPGNAEVAGNLGIVRAARTAQVTSTLGDLARKRDEAQRELMRKVEQTNKALDEAAAASAHGSNAADKLDGERSKIEASRVFENAGDRVQRTPDSSAVDAARRPLAVPPQVAASKAYRDLDAQLNEVNGRRQKVDRRLQEVQKSKQQGKGDRASLEIEEVRLKDQIDRLDIQGTALVFKKEELIRAATSVTPPKKTEDFPVSFDEEPKKH